jgi:hypothetical protein
MNKTLLNFEEFTMLNESFKSKIISRLFQEGEINTKDASQKALFNQVTDDEVIGVANDEEEAKKMLHDTLGDKKEIRFHGHRVWHQVGPDDWDDDWEDDYDSPYTYNRTVEGYTDWVFKLNSGKFLVLRIDKDELRSRFRKIHDPRYWNKENDKKLSDSRIKFQQRKEFVEKNKEDIKKYREFKKLLEENGVWDEFVKKTKEDVESWIKDYSKDKNFEDELVDNHGDDYNIYNELDYELGDFEITLEVNGEVHASVEFWSEGATYWSPAESGYNIESCEIFATSIIIALYDIKDNSQAFFDFTYLPDFDKDVNLINDAYDSF